MFELSQHPAKILSLLTTREEKKGNEPQPAIALSVEIETTNDILSHFGPDLRQSFFTKLQNVGNIDEQAQIEGVAAEMPNLRNPEIDSAVALNFDGQGYDVLIHQGATDKPWVELDDCKVNSVKVRNKEGGTVIVQFRVQAVVDPTKITGRLHALLKQNRPITLVPPSEEEQARLAAEAEGGDEE